METGWIAKQLPARIVCSLVKIKWFMAIDHVKQKFIDEDIDSVDFDTFTETLFGFVIVAGTGTESCGVEPEGVRPIKSCGRM